MTTEQNEIANIPLKHLKEKNNHFWFGVYDLIFVFLIGMIGSQEGFSHHCNKGLDNNLRTINWHIQR